MTATSIHDLFVHSLEDIYYAEGELLEALEKLADNTENEEIAEAFREHREETEEHIDRLEKVFDIVGHEPEREECEGIEGLIEEHEEFAGEDPEQHVLDLHNLVAAQKTEHYEISAYGNLALFADRLGYDEAGDIFHENLEEEEAALEKLKDLTEQYDYEEKIESASAD
jgi:ferritin-like metal-binding protein YciE